MFKGDMNKKRAKALQKVKDAITLHGGQTILSTGITGDDARLAKAVCEAGVKLLEPNHPALALARGGKQHARGRTNPPRNHQQPDGRSSTWRT